MKNKIEKTLKSLKESLSPDLGEQLQHWHDYLCYEKQSSLHTVYNYLLDINEFLDFLLNYCGCKPTLETIINLDLSGFRSFLAHQVRKNKSAISNKRILSSLRNLYRFIQKRTGLKSAYIDEISSPKAEKKLPKPIPFRQAEQLNDLSLFYAGKPAWIVARDEALLMLLYGCGLRISEAINLNIRDINQDALRIIGKRNKERIVPLLPLVYEKILAYLDKRPGGSERDAPLFIGAKGDRLNPRMIQKAMEHIRLLLGLPETATPHSLRHSYASHLLAGGADLRSIQELLGHDSLASTQVYTQLEDQALLDVYFKTHPRAK